MRAPSGDQPPKSWIAAGLAVSSRGSASLGIDQQQLLALVAAAVDPVDQPVIHRRAPQERDLLVVEGELPVFAGREVRATTPVAGPNLAGGTAFVPSREKRCGGGADRDEGFRDRVSCESIPCRPGLESATG